MQGFCELVEIAGRPGFHACKKCGRGRFWPNEQKRPKPLPANYRRPCPESPATAPIEPVALTAPADVLDRLPTLRERAKNYSDALSRQMAAGNPLRSDAETALIYAVCENCPSGKFKPDPLLPIVMGGGQCTACGCGLSKVRKIFNAARFATYRCKLGHWNELPITYVAVADEAAKEQSTPPAQP